MGDGPAPRADPGRVFFARPNILIGIRGPGMGLPSECGSGHLLGETVGCGGCAAETLPSTALRDNRLVGKALWSVMATLALAFAIVGCARKDEESKEYLADVGGFALAATPHPEQDLREVLVGDFHANEDDGECIAAEVFEDPPQPATSPLTGTSEYSYLGPELVAVAARCRVEPDELWRTQLRDGSGIQPARYAADLELESRADDAAVYILTNVGDRDDTYTITINDPSASVSPDEVHLVAGDSREIGLSGADAGSTLTVESGTMLGVVATATTK